MDYNTVIIGSGVAGMTAAIYLARANVSVCILEKEAPGGQIIRTSAIENYPGFISIDGPDLALSIYNQVKSLNVEYKFIEALEILSQDNKKIVRTNNGEISCQNIIIATGRSPRKLGVPNEDKLIGSGISYCAICDGSLYKNQDVAVVGGGRAALEETLYLSKICNNVTLIHRRDSFRAEDELIEEVKSTDNVKILTNQTVERFIEDNKRLSGIVLNNGQENIEIKVSGCFEYIGQIPNTDSFKELEILDDNGYILVDDNHETKIDNIYAIGDCTKKDLYQIITACSDGAEVASKIS